MVILLIYANSSSKSLTFLPLLASAMLVSINLNTQKHVSIFYFVIPWLRKRCTANKKNSLAIFVFKKTFTNFSINEDILEGQVFLHSIDMYILTFMATLQSKDQVKFSELNSDFSNYIFVSCFNF